MALLLVRHAHAGSRRDWAEDDGERRLSAKGRHQAEALARLLAEFSPSRVLASPAVRCRETVAPLAGALGLPVETAPALAEGSALAATELVRSLAGEKIALCSHGDVIPAVVMAIAGDDGIDLEVGVRLPDSGAAKASVWVLEGAAGRFVTARYLPPPA